MSMVGGAALPPNTSPERSPPPQTPHLNFMRGLVPQTPLRNLCRAGPRLGLGPAHVRCMFPMGSLAFCIWRRLFSLVFFCWLGDLAVLN